MFESEFTFVDTNVLVYAHDKQDVKRCDLAQTELLRLWDTGEGALSTQVLQEFYVTATNKLKPAIEKPQAREIIAQYSEWPVVQIDTTMILAASQFQQEHMTSFWDALIIEAAKLVGASTLLTEDLQDGRSFDGVRVRNPFI